MCKPDNRKWLIVTGGLLAVIITLSVILAVTLSGRASGASGARDPANLRQAVDSIDGIPLFTAYIPEDSPGRPGVLRTVESITIHETANTSEGADAEAHSDYLSTTSDEVSWHYTVDDHEIYHHLPDDEPGYHAGDRMDEDGGNMNGIGIEMCVNSDGNYEQTLINTEKLCARLLIEYDLNPSKALKKHQDFSGKICPSTLINSGRWDEFCSAVTAKYKELKADEAAKAS